MQDSVILIIERQKNVMNTNAFIFANVIDTGDCSGLLYKVPMDEHVAYYEDHIIFAIYY